MSQLIKIISVFSSFAINWVNGYSQQTSVICIYFEEDTEFLNVSIREDLTFTSFIIVQKGFETEEQRRKVLEEYHHQVDSYQPPPSFTINFLSTSKPEKVISIDESQCLRLVTVNDLRKEGLGGSLVMFINKLPDDKFLKWIAVLMAKE